MPKDGIAIDDEGHVMPYTSEQVLDITAKALEQGKLLAMVIEMPSGDLAVQVMGEPDPRIGETLITAGQSYAKALKAQ